MRGKKIQETRFTLHDSEKLFGKNSNYLCTACAKYAENLMLSPQQKRKKSTEVNNNEHEEENTENYIIILEIIMKILITNVRPKIYLSHMLNNYLIDILANSDCSGVPYEKWATLTS